MTKNEVTVNTNEITFEAIALKWLESKKGKVKDISYVRYVSILNTICKKLSGVSIADVSSKEFLLDLKENFANDNVAAKTIENYFVIIKAIIRYYNDEVIKNIGMAQKTHTW